MTTIAFDPVIFRAQFPEFANETTYPDAMLQMYWDNATCYVDDNGSYGVLQGTCRRLALNYMTAHLLQIAAFIASGQTPAIVTNATVDKVSVTTTPPDNKNHWQYWLSTTGYGQQLLALLKAKSVGGFYIGGLPETDPFTKVGGIN